VTAWPEVSLRPGPWWPAQSVARDGPQARICHHLGMTELREAEGLTVAEVMHRHVSTVPASATVHEVREYFAASGSRRVALLVDGERYVGSIPATELPAYVDPAGPAAVHAVAGPTVRPHAPAVQARELALEDPTRRVAVVDDNGALVGIVAVTEDRLRFCGT
jgi:CBS domain-containing protein